MARPVPKNSFFEDVIAKANSAFEKGLTPAEVKKAAENAEQRSKKHAMLHDNTISAATNFFLAQDRSVAVLGRSQQDEGGRFEDVWPTIEHGDFTGKKFITFPDFYRDESTCVVIDLEKKKIELSNSNGEESDDANFAQLQLMLRQKFHPATPADFEIVRVKRLMQPKDQTDLQSFHLVLNSCFAIYEKETPANIAQIKKVVAFVFGEADERFLAGANDVAALRDLVRAKYDALDAGAKALVEKRIVAAAKVNSAALQKGPAATLGVGNARRALARNSEDRMDALLDEIINLGNGSSDDRNDPERARRDDPERRRMFKEARDFALREKFDRRGRGVLQGKSAWSAQMGVSSSLAPLEADLPTISASSDGDDSPFAKFVRGYRNAVTAAGAVSVPLPVVNHELAARIALEWSKFQRPSLQKKAREDVRVEMGGLRERLDTLNNLYVLPGDLDNEHKDVRLGIQETEREIAALDEIVARAADVEPLNEDERFAEYKKIIDRHLSSITALDNFHKTLKPLFTILNAEEHEGVAIATTQYFLAACSRSVAKHFFQTSTFKELTQDGQPLAADLMQLKQSELLLTAVEEGDVEDLAKIEKMLLYGDANPFYDRWLYEGEATNDAFTKAIISGNQKLVDIFCSNIDNPDQVLPRHRQLAAEHHMELALGADSVVIINGDLNEATEQAFRDFLGNRITLPPAPPADLDFTILEHQEVLRQFLSSTPKYTPDIQALFLGMVLREAAYRNRPDRNNIIEALAKKDALLDLEVLKLVKLDEFLQDTGVNLNIRREIASKLCREAVKNRCPVAVVKELFEKTNGVLNVAPAALFRIARYRSFLQDAIRSADKDVIKFLLEFAETLYKNDRLDQDPTELFQDTFRDVIRARNADIYEIFLEHGVSVHYLNDDGSFTNLVDGIDDDKRREFLSKALMAALRQGRRNHLGQVVNFMANINYLLLAGADVNYRDKDGKTPFEAAIEGRCEDLFVLLRGLDKKIKTSAGKPVMHEAVLKYVDDLVYLDEDNRGRAGNLVEFLTNYSDQNTQAIFEKNSDGKDIFKILQEKSEAKKIAGTSSPEVIARVELVNANIEFAKMQLERLIALDLQARVAAIFPNVADQHFVFRPSSVDVAIEPLLGKPYYQFIDAVTGNIISSQYSTGYLHEFTVNLENAEREKVDNLRRQLSQIAAQTKGVQAGINSAIGGDRNFELEVDLAKLLNKRSTTLDQLLNFSQVSHSESEVLPNILHDLINERQDIAKIVSAEQKVNGFKNGSTAFLQARSDQQIKKLINGGASILAEVAKPDGSGAPLIDLVTDADYKKKLLTFAMAAAIARGKKEDVAEVKSLIDKGADINADIEAPEPPMQEARNLLKLAISHNNIAMVQFLLRNGAKIVADDTHLNPVKYALMHCPDVDLEMIRTLVNFRPSVLLELGRDGGVLANLLHPDPAVQAGRAGIMNYLVNKTNKLLFEALDSKRGQEGLSIQAPVIVSRNQHASQMLSIEQPAVGGMLPVDNIQITRSVDDNGRIQYVSDENNIAQAVRKVHRHIGFNVVEVSKQPEKAKLETGAIKFIKAGKIKEFLEHVQSYISLSENNRNDLLFRIVLASKRQENIDNEHFSSAIDELLERYANPLAVVFDPRNNVGGRARETIEFVKEPELRKRFLSRALHKNLEFFHDSFSKNFHSKALLERGADLMARFNKDKNNNLLHEAIRYRNFEMVDVILAENKKQLKNSAPSVRNLLFDVNSDGKTPLMLAASLTRRNNNGIEVDDDEGSAKMVRHILAQAEDPRALLQLGDNKKTALMVAAQNGCEQTVKVLVEYSMAHNVELDAEDKSGKNALKYAQDSAAATAPIGTAMNHVLFDNCTKVVHILSRQSQRTIDLTEEREPPKGPSEKMLRLGQARKDIMALREKFREKLAGKKGGLFVSIHDFVRFSDMMKDDLVRSKDGKMIRVQVTDKDRNPIMKYEDSEPGKCLKGCHAEGVSIEEVLQKGRVSLTCKELKFTGANPSNLTKLEEDGNNTRHKAQYCKLEGSLAQFYSAKVKKDNGEEFEEQGFFQPYNAIFDGIHFDESQGQIFNGAKLWGVTFKNCCLDGVDFSRIDPGIFANPDKTFKDCSLQNVKWPEGIESIRLNDKNGKLKVHYFGELPSTSVRANTAYPFNNLNSSVERQRQ